VGEQLSAPLRLDLGRPVGHCVRRPSPFLRHRRLRLSGAVLDPGRSRGQERGAIGGAISSTSFGEAAGGAPLTDAFSASRMRTPLGPSRSSWSLDRLPTASDALVSLAGTPESVSETARCALRCVGPCGTPSHEVKPASQRTPERLTGKGETHGSPRAPSVVSRIRRCVTCRPSAH
jgi:hypothetical protein